MTIFTNKELNSLYQYSYSLCNNEDLAYDLLQSALEKVLRQTQTVVSKQMSYTKTAIRNLYIDHYRRAKNLPHDSLNTTQISGETMENIASILGTESLETVMINSDLLEKIWDTLDDFEREILVLWALEGYTTEEIAQQLESKKGTIVSRIHRLRIKLQYRSAQLFSEANS